MCISYNPFDVDSDVSCDDTQFFLAENVDKTHVHLLGLLPVKSTSASLLFYPVAPEFSSRITQVGQVKCQADRIKIVTNPPPVMTRSIMGGSSFVPVRVVKNQDGSVVCIFHSSRVSVSETVCALGDVLRDNGVDVARVMPNGQDHFMQELGNHFKPENDMIVCVPKFNEGKPDLDGSGFSIQFVWPKTEFSNDIPLLGLVHNHQPSAAVSENYHFMTSLPRTKMVFNPRENVGIGTEFFMPVLNTDSFLEKYGGVQTDLKKIVETARNRSQIELIGSDLSEASQVKLEFATPSYVNLKGHRIDGATRCFIIW